MKTLREIINLELSERGWSVLKLANESGVPQPTLQRYLSGVHGEPRSTTIKKIAAGLGLTEIALRNRFMVNETEVKPESNAVFIGGFDLWDNNTPLGEDEVALPYYREVEMSAGSGRHQVIENHGCKLRFAKSTLKNRGVHPENAACVSVSGTSMEPVLPDGSTIGIDKGNTKIMDGYIYAIDHNGELRVKMIYKMPGGGIRLKSYNSEEYPDEQYPGDAASAIKILGRIFWSSTLW